MVHSSFISNIGFKLNLEKEYRLRSFLEIVIIYNNSEQPVTIKNYLPGEKHIVFDIVSRKAMPVCKF